MQKGQIPNLNLAYDMLPVMQMMEAPDKSEFFYRHRTEDGRKKSSNPLPNNLADPRPPRYSGGLVVSRLQQGGNGCRLSIQKGV